MEKAYNTDTVKSTESANVPTRRQRHVNTRFLMLEDDKRIWMTFEDCYRALDAGWSAFIDGGLALDVAGSGTERPLTPQEKADITNAADDFSGSK